MNGWLYEGGFHNWKWDVCDYEVTTITKYPTTTTRNHTMMISSKTWQGKPDGSERILFQKEIAFVPVSQMPPTLRVGTLHAWEKPGRGKGYKEDSVVPPTRDIVRGRKVTYVWQSMTSIAVTFRVLQMKPPMIGSRRSVLGLGWMDGWSCLKSL
ncbi:hypothetical protein E6O75_ATG09285 [Venturia nashicola]|uniref:Uncharacterized protein n=1 Tax=Venturia nashicola TaxID=86259 RepID=A0A4Z1P1Q0_9PEZI|nr:hypothetical protein E6O75_ATG09285 [Venturia nashicola]